MNVHWTLSMLLSVSWFLSIESVLSFLFFYYSVTSAVSNSQMFCVLSSFSVDLFVFSLLHSGDLRHTRGIILSVWSCFFLWSWIFLKKKINTTLSKSIQICSVTCSRFRKFTTYWSLDCIFTEITFHFSNALNCWHIFLKRIACSL